MRRARTRVNQRANGTAVALFGPEVLTQQVGRSPTASPNCKRRRNAHLSRPRTAVGRLPPTATRSAPNPPCAAAMEYAVECAALPVTPHTHHSPNGFRAMNIFATFGDRRAHGDNLLPILDRVFVSRTTHDWLDVLHVAGVPCALVNSVSQARADEQTLARGMVVETEHAEFGAVR